ncbi:hypothetical protein [Desulfitobacterium sp.]|uniref:hypothetical protein n=1 Tax=Desulfitobacterium sp. TaxID=49981 RepID=UPI002CF73776|nr:hypothetical protein [Desulfitobacterium sp.]HVJ48759.1 hypothetical protein [Desulfitobacterium sp.]
MGTIESLATICTDFKERKYDLEELQSRLETLMITDDLKLNLEKERNDALNRLEEIRFTSLEANYFKYGLEVANGLLEKIQAFRNS